MPEESVSESVGRTAATVDAKRLGKDNVARLLVFDSLANTLKPAKLHYDQVCQSVNSYQERNEERYLRDCIGRYRITNQNLWLLVFKWGLKELGLMKDFKNMTGPNILYHDSNGGKYQEMGQILNSRNYFQEGNWQLILDLPYDPYYSEIWGNVSSVSHLIFPFIPIIFCWHWLLSLLRTRPIEMNPRTKAGMISLLFFARSTIISWKKSSFGPHCSGRYSVRRYKSACHRRLRKTFGMIRKIT